MSVDRVRSRASSKVAGSKLQSWQYFLRQKLCLNPTHHASCTKIGLQHVGDVDCCHQVSCTSCFCTSDQLNQKEPSVWPKKSSDSPNHKFLRVDKLLALNKQYSSVQWKLTFDSSIPLSKINSGIQIIFLSSSPIRFLRVPSFFKFEKVNLQSFLLTKFGK